MFLYNVTIKNIYMDTLKMLAVVTGTDMYADGNWKQGCGSVS